MIYELNDKEYVTAKVVSTLTVYASFLESDDFGSFWKGVDGIIYYVFI